MATRTETIKNFIHWSDTTQYDIQVEYNSVSDILTIVDTRFGNKLDICAEAIDDLIEAIKKVRPV